MVRSQWNRLPLILVTLTFGAAQVFAQNTAPTFYLENSNPIGIAAPASQSGFYQPTHETSGATLKRLPASLVSYESSDTSLETRVKELETQLKKIKAKEDAKAKKAASKPSVKVGGRIHLDTNAFIQDDISELQAKQHDAVGFRRARLKAFGEMFHVIDYKIAFDFANIGPEVRYKDVYITFKELPYLGHVRVGHFKEPFSLEHIESSDNFTLMERSLGTETFVPNRNLGVMAFDTWADERGTWAIGGFSRRTQDEGRRFESVESGGMAMTMRGTFLPWYDEASNGRRLLHTGLGYSYRDVSNRGGGVWDLVRFRARPEAYFAKRVVDTGNLNDIPAYQVLGAEAALVHGPFSVQSEWFGAFVRQSGNQRDLSFNGCYGQVSYFLTGEHRPYKKSAGAFGRVVPHENFFRVRTENGNICTGLGAWELAYRYSYLDLTSLDVAGGRVGDHTCGVNWYLNPYARIMFNYVYSQTWDSLGEGDLNIFETRFQVTF